MAIALVQQKAGSGSIADGADLTVTFDAPGAVGSVIVCQVGFGTSFGSPSGITDDAAGETWTKRKEYTSNGNVSSWVRTAGADGLAAVLIRNGAGAERAMGAVISEWSGLTVTAGATAEEDGTNGVATVVTPPVTPTVVPSLVLATVEARQTTVSDITLSAGYTEFTAPADVGDSSFAMGYIICTTDEARTLTATADLAITTGTNFVAIQNILLGTGAIIQQRPNQQSFLPLLLAN